MGRVRRLLGRLGDVARAVMGVPDYDRYLAHMRACHPLIQPMSAAEFARDCLEARYSRVGSKCC
jgi:uncharacterized short protein YbdD (DUF466 family)